MQLRHGHGMDLSLIARDSVFPLARAIEAGIGPDELQRRRRRGECHRLHHGWVTTADPTDALVRHRLRTVALLEQYHGKAVASHVSALIRLDLPTYEPELSVVHLMAVDPSSRGHRKPDLLIHPRPAGPARSRAPRGGSTGSAPEPAMTRVAAVPADWDGPDAGAPSLDLRGALPDSRRGTTHPALAIAFAGLSDPRAFLVPADAALHGGVATRDDLVRAVSILDRRPGVNRVRAALPLCDHRHESPGETLTAFVLRMLGYRVVPQFGVPGTGDWTPRGQGYRADFGIVGSKVLVEFDGRVKYSSVATLWDEKQREDRIRSLGYEVVRVTWADLNNPERVRSLIQAAIRRSAARN
jgi:hypothetical protein